MPRRSHQLGAADYALLGLLMLGPRHGYELAPYFASDGTLGLVCTLGVSRLYAILHALEELGFVHADGVGIDRRPFEATSESEDHARIDATGEIRPNRNIRAQALFDRLQQKALELIYQRPRIVAPQFLAPPREIHFPISPLSNNWTVTRPPRRNL